MTRCARTVGTWPRGVAAVLVCAVLAGCGITRGLVGTHIYGPWYRHELIEFSEDGKFRYEFWSDDGGAVCFARGSWVRLEDGSVETRVETVIPGTSTECSLLQSVDRWASSGDRLFHGQHGPFRRAKSDYFSEGAPSISD